MWKKILFFFCLLPFSVSAQSDLRGHVYDESNGQSLPYCHLRVGEVATYTNHEGFFNLSGLVEGNQVLVATYLGFDSICLPVALQKGQVQYIQVFLKPASLQLKEVSVSATKELSKLEVKLSQTTISANKIQSMPSIGASADLAQYLSLAPGVVNTGDQAGRIFIRGGEPVQNEVLLDGAGIFNPFHSIGLFSVFETETIQSVDIYSAGFGAAYGGRTSAIIDVKTREADKRKLRGVVSASPFQIKALLEGPIQKLDASTGNSLTMMVTGKKGWLDQTSPVFYQYAIDTSFLNFGEKSLQNSLPYSYEDVFAKISYHAGAGSRINLFAFRFSDAFESEGLASLTWKNTGGGLNFNLLPARSKMILDGEVTFSNYQSDLVENVLAPKSSGINKLTAGLNFKLFGPRNQLSYGFGFSGLKTNLQFENSFGSSFQQKDFTSELAGYFSYRQILNKWVLEPGFRLQYYASQPAFSMEPRLGLKFNATESLRFKAGGGLYSQNLLGISNAEDIVQLFTGFLTGPSQTLFEPGTDIPVKNSLQKARHWVAGLEWDPSVYWSIGVEVYQKYFDPMIQLNRYRTRSTQPDYILEKGEITGIDATMTFTQSRWDAYVAYSFGKNQRDDGTEAYPPAFDRRHSFNTLFNYALDPGSLWKINLRWNVGSGLPFTQTQGFYQQLQPDQFNTGSILTGNHPIGILLADERNGGRLPYFHRLDLGLTRIWNIGAQGNIELNLSVSNVYNRRNVYYVNRFNGQVVKQLPIIPALGITGRW